MANTYKLLNQEKLEDISPSNPNVENENNDAMGDESNCLTNTMMTESYSEILNSPTTDAYDEPGTYVNTPIVITKRRSNSSSHHESSQCKSFILLKFIYNLLIFLVVKKLQHLFHMDRYEWMKAK